MLKLESSAQTLIEANAGDDVDIGKEEQDEGINVASSLHPATLSLCRKSKLSP